MSVTKHTMQLFGTLRKTYGDGLTSQQETSSHMKRVKGFAAGAAACSSAVSQVQTFFSFFFCFFKALRSSSTAFAASVLSMNLIPASMAWRRRGGIVHNYGEVQEKQQLHGCLPQILCCLRRKICSLVVNACGDAVPDAVSTLACRPHSPFHLLLLVYSSYEFDLACPLKQARLQAWRRSSWERMRTLYTSREHHALRAR